MKLCYTKRYFKRKNKDLIIQKDIIIESENGFFFEVGDEKELAKKIIESKDLSFDGYNYISNNFSLNNMLDKTINVYKGL